MKKINPQLLIIILGVLFFIPFLGNVHLFDWDEINFAEAAREMIVTGDYLRVRIDFEPFHEKPPLFIWLQVLSMKVFGINEFAARLPNALIGIATLLILFNIGKKMFDSNFGLIWVLAYIGSFLPHFYFKTGIIDPLFNLLMFLGVYYLFKFELQRLSENITQRKDLLIAAAMTALAVLTKGPVGFLLVFLSWAVFWIVHNKKLKFPFVEIVIFSLIAAIPTVLWYIAVLSEAGGNIIVEFFTYQIRLLTTSDAGHAGPFYYHFIVLLFGCFPASIFAISGWKANSEDSFAQNKFRLINIILLIIVLLIFSIVKTKIVHYSSLAYFPITFLAAYSIYNVQYRNQKYAKYITYSTAVIGLTLAVALALFPIALMNLDLFIDKVTDKFTYAVLLSEANWLGIEYFVGILYFVAILFAVIMLAKSRFLKGVYLLFAATAVTIFMIMPLIIPRVEEYTQNANIEFFKSLQGKDVYIQTLDFKSYGQHFYTMKQKSQSKYYMQNPPDDMKEWLLSGDIDKDAYFVSRNKKAEQYLEKYDITELERKNGFVYFVRYAKGQPQNSNKH